MLPLASCYAIVLKAVSTEFRIHTFMYLIFLCLLLKKVALLFCPGKARETSQIFSRTAKNPGLFQDVVTLYNVVTHRLDGQTVNARTSCAGGREFVSERSAKS